MTRVLLTSACSQSPIWGILSFRQMAIGYAGLIASQRRTVVPLEITRAHNELPERYLFAWTRNYPCSLVPPSPPFFCRSKNHGLSILITVDKCVCYPFRRSCSVSRYLCVPFGKEIHDILEESTKQYSKVSQKGYGACGQTCYTAQQTEEVGSWSWTSCTW